MDWLIFGRVDYVITKLILGIAVISSVMFGLIGPVIDAVSKAPLPIFYPTTVRSGIELPRGTTHDGEVSVPLLLHDPTLGERLSSGAPNLLLAATIIAISWLLFHLLRSTEAREPFTRRNVRRINMMALIVGVGGTVTQFVQGFADSAILTSGRLPDSSANGLIFELSFSLFPLVVMLLLALIGEAFRRGVELREDVEGLV